MSSSPPLRFLVLVLGGWICLRAALLGGGWWTENGLPARPIASERAQAIREAIAAPQGVVAPSALAASLVSLRKDETAGLPPSSPRIVSVTLDQPTAAAQPEVMRAVTPVPVMPPPAGTERRGRWSGSGWLFLREGGGKALVPGGTLGGSQLGARIAYRLNGDSDRPLALSLRAYAPLDNMDAAEAAVGIDWRPVSGIPVNLLAERRQAAGKEGRSAFSLTAYGGASDVRAGPLRVDAYVQAGIVGARSRDLFADGSARLSLPLGAVKAGAGAWGAAQPGTERLDVGPRASVRLPIEGANVVLAVDWRLRIAGDAAPASGPTLTLGTDF